DAYFSIKVFVPEYHFKLGINLDAFALHRSISLSFQFVGERFRTVGAGLLTKLGRAETSRH
ncbi:hypothetical protein, partial [Chroococcidiopsis cubana]|uniref:hypothetical protein n=1 Tax=Chroococcidiopsis cubana TaxID=171392 RepID=UPI001A7ED996